jgi:hypothetical protein
MVREHRDDSHTKTPTLYPSLNICIWEFFGTLSDMMGGEFDVWSSGSVVEGVSRSWIVYFIYSKRCGWYCRPLLLSFHTFMTRGRAQFSFFDKNREYTMGMTWICFHYNHHRHTPTHLPTQRPPHHHHHHLSRRPYRHPVTRPNPRRDPLLTT